MLYYAQVVAAVAAAKEAFPAWSERSPEQRAQVLNKLADLIEANLEEFAQAESRDQGICLHIVIVKLARPLDGNLWPHRGFYFFKCSNNS